MVLKRNYVSSVPFKVVVLVLLEVLYQLNCRSTTMPLIPSCKVIEVASCFPCVDDDLFRHASVIRSGGEEENRDYTKE